MTALAQPQQVDPRDLTQQQRRAVDLLGRGLKLYRQTRGWGITPNHVTLTIAAQLRGLDIVRTDYSGRNPRIVLTGVGMNTFAIMQSRRELRR